MTTQIRYDALASRKELPQSHRAAWGTLCSLRNPLMDSVLRIPRYLRAVDNLRKSSKIFIDGKECFKPLTELEEIKDFQVPRVPRKSSVSARTYMARAKKSLDEGDFRKAVTTINFAFRVVPQPSALNEDCSKWSLSDVIELIGDLHGFRATALSKLNFIPECMRDCERGFSFFMQRPLSLKMLQKVGDLVSTESMCLMSINRHSMAVTFSTAHKTLLKKVVADLQDQIGRQSSSSVGDGVSHREDWMALCEKIQSEVDQVHVKMEEVDNSDTARDVESSENVTTLGDLAKKRRERKQEGLRNLPPSIFSPRVLAEMPDPHSATGFSCKAKADINPGDLLGVVRPLHASPAPSTYLTRCYACSESLGPLIFPCPTCADIAYCSEACFERDQVFHRHECRVLPILGALVQSGVICVPLFRIIVQKDVKYWESDLFFLPERFPRPLDKEFRLKGRKPHISYPDEEYEKTRMLPLNLQARSKEQLHFATVETLIILACLDAEFIRGRCSPEVRVHIAVVIFYHLLSSHWCLKGIEAADFSPESGTNTIQARSTMQASAAVINEMKSGDERGGARKRKKTGEGHVGRKNAEPGEVHSAQQDEKKQKREEPKKKSPKGHQPQPMATSTPVRGDSCEQVSVIAMLSSNAGQGYNEVERAKRLKAGMSKFLCCDDDAPPAKSPELEVAGAGVPSAGKDIKEEAAEKKSTAMQTSDLRAERKEAGDSSSVIGTEKKGDRRDRGTAKKKREKAMNNFLSDGNDDVGTAESLVAVPAVRVSTAKDALIEGKGEGKQGAEEVSTIDTIIQIEDLSTEKNKVVDFSVIVEDGQCRDGMKRSGKTGEDVLKNSTDHGDGSATSNNPDLPIADVRVTSAGTVLDEGEDGDKRGTASTIMSVAEPENSDVVGPSSSSNEGHDQDEIEKAEGTRDDGPEKSLDDGDNGAESRWVHPRCRFPLPRRERMTSTGPSSDQEDIEEQGVAFGPIGELMAQSMKQCFSGEEDEADETPIPTNEESVCRAFENPPPGFSFGNVSIMDEENSIVTIAWEEEENIVANFVGNDRPVAATVELNGTAPQLTTPDLVPVPDPVTPPETPRWRRNRRRALLIPSVEDAFDSSATPLREEEKSLDGVTPPQKEAVELVGESAVDLATPVQKDGVQSSADQSVDVLATLRVTDEGHESVQQPSDNGTPEPERVLLQPVESTPVSGSKPVKGSEKDPDGSSVEPVSPIGVLIGNKLYVDMPATAKKAPKNKTLKSPARSLELKEDPLDHQRPLLLREEPCPDYRSMVERNFFQTSVKAKEEKGETTKPTPRVDGKNSDGRLVASNTDQRQEQDTHALNEAWQSIQLEPTKSAAPEKQEGAKDKSVMLGDERTILQISSDGEVLQAAADALNDPRAFCFGDFLVPISLTEEEAEVQRFPSPKKSKPRAKLLSVSEIVAKFEPRDETPAKQPASVEMAPHPLLTIAQKTRGSHSLTNPLETVESGKITEMMPDPYGTTSGVSGNQNKGHRFRLKHDVLEGTGNEARKKGSLPTKPVNPNKKPADENEGWQHVLATPLKNENTGEDVDEVEHLLAGSSVKTHVANFTRFFETPAKRGQCGRMNEGSTFSYPVEETPRAGISKTRVIWSPNGGAVSAASEPAVCDGSVVPVMLEEGSTRNVDVDGRSLGVRGKQTPLKEQDPLQNQPEPKIDATPVLTDSHPPQLESVRKKIAAFEGKVSQPGANPEKENADGRKWLGGVWKTVGPKQTISGADFKADTNEYPPLEAMPKKEKLPDVRLKPSTPFATPKTSYASAARATSQHSQTAAVFQQPPASVIAAFQQPRSGSQWPTPRLAEVNSSMGRSATPKSPSTAPGHPKRRTRIERLKSEVEDENSISATKEEFFDESPQKAPMADAVVQTPCSKRVEKRVDTAEKEDPHHQRPVEGKKSVKGVDVSVKTTPSKKKKLEPVYHQDNLRTPHWDQSRAESGCKGRHQDAGCTSVAKIVKKIERIGAEEPSVNIAVNREQEQGRTTGATVLAKTGTDVKKIVQQIEQTSVISHQSCHPGAQKISSQLAADVKELPGTEKLRSTEGTLLPAPVVEKAAVDKKPEATSSQEKDMNVKAPEPETLPASICKEQRVPGVDLKVLGEDVISEEISREKNSPGNAVQEQQLDEVTAKGKKDEKPSKKLKNKKKKKKKHHMEITCADDEDSSLVHGAVTEENTETSLDQNLKPEGSEIVAKLPAGDEAEEQKKTSSTSPPAELPGSPEEATVQPNVEQVPNSEVPEKVATVVESSSVLLDLPEEYKLPSSPSEIPHLEEKRSPGTSKAETQAKKKRPKHSSNQADSNNERTPASKRPLDEEEMGNGRRKKKGRRSSKSEKQGSHVKIVKGVNSSACFGDVPYANVVGDESFASGSAAADHQVAATHDPPGGDSSPVKSCPASETSETALSSTPRRGLGNAKLPPGFFLSGRSDQPPVAESLASRERIEELTEIFRPKLFLGPPESLSSASEPSEVDLWETAKIWDSSDGDDDAGVTQESVKSDAGPPVEETNEDVEPTVAVSEADEPQALDSKSKKKRKNKKKRSKQGKEKGMKADLTVQSQRKSSGTAGSTSGPVTDDVLMSMLPTVEATADDTEIGVRICAIVEDVIGADEEGATASNMEAGIVPEETCEETVPHQDEPEPMDTSEPPEFFPQEEVRALWGRPVEEQQEEVVPLPGPAGNTGEPNRNRLVSLSCSTKSTLSSIGSSSEDDVPGDKPQGHRRPLRSKADPTLVSGALDFAAKGRLSSDDFADMFFNHVPCVPSSESSESRSKQIPPGFECETFTISAIYDILEFARSCESVSNSCDHRDIFCGLQKGHKVDKKDEDYEGVNVMFTTLAAGEQPSLLKPPSSAPASGDDRGRLFKRSSSNQMLASRDLGKTEKTTKSAKRRGKKKAAAERAANRQLQTTNSSASAVAETDHVEPLLEPFDLEEACKRMSYLDTAPTDESYKYPDDWEGIPVSQRTLAVGIYPGMATFNHSCQPNAAICERFGDVMYIRAIKPIKVGEEITIAYGDSANGFPEASLAHRQQFTEDHFHFKCTCLPCTDPSMQEDLQDPDVLKLRCPNCSSPVVVPHEGIAALAETDTRCVECDTSVNSIALDYVNRSWVFDFVLRQLMVDSTTPNQNARLINELWDHVSFMYRNLVSRTYQHPLHLTEKIRQCYPFAGGNVSDGFHWPAYCRRILGLDDMVFPKPEPPKNALYENAMILKDPKDEPEPDDDDISKAFEQRKETAEENVDKNVPPNTSDKEEETA